MSNRASRVQAFKAFKESSKEKFNQILDGCEKSKRLSVLYTLNICPGGRFGRLSEKLVEVFYGNLSIGISTTPGDNFKKKTVVEIAHGATLSYQRTDDGHVMCHLYPSKSENLRPREEMIALDYIKDPKELENRVESHLKMFISYMEVTCIDGEPNIVDQCRVFYIRNVKRYSEGSIFQSRKIIVLFKEVMKYVLTIGLSGFLILLFSLVKERVEESESSIRHQKTVTILKAIDDSTNELNDTISEIKSLHEKIVLLGHDSKVIDEKIVEQLMSTNINIIETNSQLNSLVEITGSLNETVNSDGKTPFNKQQYQTP
jgi:hypothetical protein